VGAYGYELDFKVARAKRAKYFIDLSIITPYVTNTTDGKAPDLSDFEDAINKVVCKAANDAYRFMIRSPSAMSVKDAAYAVMKDAYLKASDNGTLPAKARQIMYAARGDIIRLTGKAKFDDKYFTRQSALRLQQRVAARRHRAAARRCRGNGSRSRGGQSR